ncbi:hypothetical protein BS78_08G133400 [Paspalum vaginatum]|nr:hypothetical protein BS78_08G133400 [Paspalum vaginatum]
MASRVDLRDAKDAGRSALHLAAANGHLDVCRFLVEELGFGVNSTCASGGSPVLYAAANGRESVLRYLIDRGADPGMPDSKGVTPLHHAAEQGHYEAVRLLLSNGVDVDPIFGHGTPLHLASPYDRDQIVKILLEHGTDPNKVSNAFSPLALACCGYSLKSMKLLVEAGADVNFICPTGESILVVAVDGGCTDIVKFLLEAGADPNVADRDGQFPIMLAADHEHREIVEILFPHTRSIPVVPDWSIDGIIVTMKSIRSKPQAMEKDPLDATLFANRSLCWLRLREGERALLDAQQCRIMCPRWSKAWYREGAALSLLKDYEGAVDSFMQALHLDPASDEINKALWEAIDAMKSAAARAEQQDP